MGDARQMTRITEQMDKMEAEAQRVPSDVSGNLRLPIPILRGWRRNERALPATDQPVLKILARQHSAVSWDTLDELRMLLDSAQRCNTGGLNLSRVIASLGETEKAHTAINTIVTTIEHQGSS